MGDDAIDALRMRAALARRLAELRPKEQADLSDMAKALDAEADKLEKNVVRIETAIRRKHEIERSS